MKICDICAEKVSLLFPAETYLKKFEIYDLCRECTIDFEEGAEKINTESNKIRIDMMYQYSKKFLMKRSKTND